MSYDPMTIGIQRKLDDAKRYWSINPFGYGAGASAMMAIGEAQIDAKAMELVEVISALENYRSIISAGDVFPTEHTERETTERVRVLTMAHLACFGAIAEHTAQHELASAS